METNISGYDNYSISTDGKVYSTVYGRKVELKQYEHKGYRRVALSKNNKRKTYPVHRLVAYSFIPNPNRKPFINHRDGNKRNNDIINLEWCTRAENQKHSREVLGNTGIGAKNSHYGYRSAKLYPNEELRNRLVELGVPRHRHNLAELGEMLPNYWQTHRIAGHPTLWEGGNVLRDSGLTPLSDKDGAGIRGNTEADARAEILCYLLENSLVTIL